MQTLDNLDGRTDAEFRELGVDAERSRAKSSKRDTGTGKEVPKDKDAERAATGVLTGPPRSSLPESNSKQSAVDESEFLQNMWNQSQRNPAIKSGDHGLTELSNELWSPIECRANEQPSQHDAHSGGSTSSDECEELGTAPVRVIDAHNLLAERAEIDRDGEILATASSAPSGYDSDSALVTRRAANL